MRDLRQQVLRDRLLPLLDIGRKPTFIARTDGRACPVLLMFQSDDRVDKPAAVLPGCALEPPRQHEHRRLKVVGCAHKPRGAPHSPGCPGNAQFIGVMGVVVQDRVERDIAECPPAKRHDPAVRRPRQTPTQKLVSWRLDGSQSAGERWPERVGYFGQHGSALIARKYILDECPLEYVTGSIAEWFDAVAPVCATHEDGYDLARTLRPHFEALIERGFVQFEMAPLKRGGKRLEGRIRINAREHRHAVGNIWSESSSTRYQRPEFGWICAPDAERFENAKG